MGSTRLSPSRRRRRFPRAFAAFASAITFALLGCAGEPSRCQRFEVETRLTERAVAASGETTEDFLLGARQIIFTSPSVLRVETTIAPVDDDGSGVAAPRQTVLSIYDIARGEVWHARDGAEPERTSFDQVDHELEIERKLALLAYADRFVRDPALRAASDEPFFRGDGTVELADAGADRLRRARVALIPGRVIALTVEDPEAAPFTQPWIAPQLLLRLLGLTRAEAAALATAVPGLPLDFEMLELASASGRISEHHRVIAAGDFTPPASFFAVPLSDARVEPERTISTWDEWLAAFAPRAGEGSGADRDGAVASEDIDATNARETDDPRRRWLDRLLVLEALDRLPASPMLEVAWQRISGPARVELMRAALRQDASSAGERLVAIARGESFELARSAVEALAFENDGRALDALGAVVDRRRQFVGPYDASALVVEWALPWLRVLSGQTWEDLAAVIAPLWSVDPAVVADGLDPAALDPAMIDLAIERELDVWLRWFERTDAVDR